MRAGTLYPKPNPYFMLPNRTVFFRGLLLVLLAWTTTAHAQVTTSAISGKVTSDKGEDLIGVTVVATNVPTGTKRGTGTELDGRFSIPNLAPGGPYSVTVTYVGYKEQTIGGVFLTLGNTTRLNVVLVTEAQQLNEVVVVGNTEATKTGAGTNVEAANRLGLCSHRGDQYGRCQERAAELHVISPHSCSAVHAAGGGGSELDPRLSVKAQ